MSHALFVSFPLKHTYNIFTRTVRAHLTVAALRRNIEYNEENVYIIYL